MPEVTELVRCASELTRPLVHVARFGRTPVGAGLGAWPVRLLQGPLGSMAPNPRPSDFKSMFHVTVELLCQIRSEKIGTLTFG